MFFRKWVVNSRYNVLFFRRIEFNKLILKSLLSCKDYINLQRFYFSFMLRSYFINGSISNYRRFCAFSLYPKSVVRFFKLSRHNAKYFASEGILSGMRKSSF